MKPERELLGTMIIALRPCGRVSATAWDDKGNEPYISQDILRWIRRGDTVLAVERYDNDPMPLWACGKGQECGCRDTGLVALE